MSETRSTREQSDMQSRVLKLFSELNLDIKNKKYRNYVVLDHESHSKYSKKALRRMPKGLTALSSGLPWLIFWNLNSLCLLGAQIEDSLKLEIINFLKQCKCLKTGVFSGGPYQMPHLAPVYSSLCSLICLNSPEGYEIVDRKGVHDFIVSMRRSDLPGSFRMHLNGESDMRSVYCAICSASIINVLDESITENVAEFIASCQKYDGGFSAEPFGEVHGGYTYCAIASLALLGKIHVIDVQSALEWLLSRQMENEGGFNGRPNKLVDSCYSFWIGAAIVILKEALNVPSSCSFVDPQALQAYILVATQSVCGFFDKPGSHPDYYHTCYALSGLSFFQKPPMFKETELDLTEIDPLVNAPKKNVMDARKFFVEKGPI